MTSHYRLSDETMTLESGEVLHRIIATQDLPMHVVTAGDVGGWLGPKAALRDSAWVADDAKVHEEAVATGYARVCERARVGGWASVGDHARVGGNAELSDRALAVGYARISGHAQLRGRAIATGRGRVCDNALVDGSAVVKGEADVSGDSTLFAEQDILTIGPVGSENCTVTLTRAQSGHVLNVGCWTGTVDELSAEVDRRSVDWGYEYDDDDAERWRDEYAAIETLCRTRIAGWSS